MSSDLTQLGKESNRIIKDWVWTHAVRQEFRLIYGQGTKTLTLPLGMPLLQAHQSPQMVGCRVRFMSFCAHPGIDGLAPYSNSRGNPCIMHSSCWRSGPSSISKTGKSKPRLRCFKTCDGNSALNIERNKALPARSLPCLYRFG